MRIPGQPVGFLKASIENAWLESVHETPVAEYARAVCAPRRIDLVGSAVQSAARFRLR